MSEEHDHDLATDIPTEQMERIEELEAGNPIETVRSLVPGDLKRELLPLLAGGVLLLSALRSLGRGQLRTVPKAAAAAGLLGYGLRNRRSSGTETFEPEMGEIEGGTEGKETSDQAKAAGGTIGDRDIDEDGGVPDSAQKEKSGSQIEFTQDSGPRTKPESVGETEDPRRNTDDDSVEIDVSDSAMAEEASEAAGPAPEQAQPSQTDATEPEETPEEDASDMKVEPDDENSSSRNDDTGSDVDETTEDDEDDDR